MGALSHKLRSAEDERVIFYCIGCNGAQPGEIIYLSDCTHSYAGKNIPLPDFPHAEWE